MKRVSEKSIDYKSLLEKFIKMVNEEGDAFYVVKYSMQSDYYREDDGSISEGQEEIAHVFSQEEIDEIVRIFGCDPRNTE